MEGFTTISDEEYKELVRDQRILDALRRGGVDNWDWYGQSLEDAGLLDD